MSRFVVVLPWGAIVLVALCGRVMAEPTPPGTAEKPDLNDHRCIRGAVENLGVLLDEFDRLDLAALRDFGRRASTAGCLVLFTVDP